VQISKFSSHHGHFVWRPLNSRILQTHERASHRWELRSLCSGADPKLRTGHSAGAAVPGFAVSPSISWRPGVISGSGRLPVRPDPASPLLYDSKPSLQAVWNVFLRVLSAQIVL